MRSLPVYKCPGGRGGCQRTRHLNASKVGLVFVDDEDYERLSTFFWTFDKKRYAVATDRVDGKQKQVYLHHMLLPAIKGMDVSHKNGNRLDNRRTNLCYASHAENCLNPNDGMKAKKKSKLPRNVFIRPYGKYFAQVVWRGKQFYSTQVNTIEEAERLAGLVRAHVLQIVEQEKAGQEVMLAGGLLRFAQVPAEEEFLMTV